MCPTPHLNVLERTSRVAHNSFIYKEGQKRLTKLFLISNHHFLMQCDINDLYGWLLTLLLMKWENIVGRLQSLLAWFPRSLILSSFLLILSHFSYSNSRFSIKGFYCLSFELVLQIATKKKWIFDQNSLRSIKVELDV